MSKRTELDALLERVVEVRLNRQHPDRMTVANDCLRMFEQVATDLQSLTDEYHAIRAALRDGLSDEENKANPESLSKIQLLISGRAKYNELVDALCSRSWLGRERHESVVGLAKRLHDSQRTLRPLELEDVALAAGYCIRKRRHEGPCNGLPRNDCHQ